LTATDTAPPTRFAAYLFTHGAWFLAFGVQLVLFPYLLRVVLKQDEVHFGIAQMCLQLPTTLFILIGGFVADRIPPRRIVAISCALSVVTFAALGGMVISGKLTYGLIIFYALSVGTIGAFAIPARDSLLSLVAPGGDGVSVHRAVTFASLAQFGAQILGMAYATAAPFLGVGPMLLSLSLLMVLAALAAVSLRPRPANRPPRGDGHLLQRMAADIGGGIQAAFSSPIIAPVVLCAMFIGICFMGSFFVLLPLIVQSYFPPNDPDPTHIATALAQFSLCFWVGSMISAIALTRFGHIRRKGLVYMASLCCGGTVLVLCSIDMPFLMLCVLNFVWGLGGGVAMTLGRGIVQQHAPAESRGRILSVFTLGLMGGGPLGALAYGFLAKAIGPHAAIMVPGLLMLTLVAGVFFLSPLRHLSEDAP
jgi:MFS family permease